AGRDAGRRCSEENADRRTKGRRRKFGKTPADEESNRRSLLARANYQLMASRPLMDGDKLLIPGTPPSACGGSRSRPTDRHQPKVRVLRRLSLRARRTYHAAAARALIHDDKLLIADAIRALAVEAGRCCGWKTPTGPPKGPHACAVGSPCLLGR